MSLENARQAVMELTGVTERDYQRKPFEELLLPVLNDLFRTAYALEGDPVEAEDLLQETVLQGFRKFDQLRTAKNFRAWMTMILRRSFLNRRSRRHPEVPLEDGEHSGVLQAQVEKPSRFDPEEQLLAKRLSHELRDALQNLHLDQRLAVLLVDLQGFSYMETADILQVSPGTVASRVARGRMALRRSLRHLARERGWVDE